MSSSEMLINHAKEKISYFPFSTYQPCTHGEGEPCILISLKNLYVDTYDIFITSPSITSFLLPSKKSTGDRECPCVYVRVHLVCASAL